ncbi:MAG: hypothetical protein RIE86_12255 [Imperialibacter sp.]|uniref:hypothetical protein n=1 Tax=Imperialibacter sp. TaxID=2038411 RepID=UPI0032EB9CB1
MGADLHPASLKALFTEELYLIGEKQSAPAPAEKPAPVVAAKPEETKTPMAEPAAPKQNTLIILKQPFQALEASQKELLTKITGAVSIDLSSAVLISESDYKANPAQTVSFSKVLSFGVELPVSTSKYSVIKRDGQQYLASDSLAALEQAIALKGKLWKAMQEMFLG